MEEVLFFSCVFLSLKVSIEGLLKYYVSSRECHSVLRGKGLVRQDLGSCSRFGTHLLHDYLQSCLICCVSSLLPPNKTWE